MPNVSFLGMSSSLLPDVVTVLMVIFLCQLNFRLLLLLLLPLLLLLLLLPLQLPLPLPLPLPLLLLLSIATHVLYSSNLHNQVQGADLEGLVSPTPKYSYKSSFKGAVHCKNIVVAGSGPGDVMETVILYRGSAHFCNLSRLLFPMACAKPRTQHVNLIRRPKLKAWTRTLNP